MHLRDIIIIYGAHASIYKALLSPPSFSPEHYLKTLVALIDKLLRGGKCHFFAGLDRRFRGIFERSIAIPFLVYLADILSTEFSQGYRITIIVTRAHLSAGFFL